MSNKSTQCDRNTVCLLTKQHSSATSMFYPFREASVHLVVNNSPSVPIFTAHPLHEIAFPSSNPFIPIVNPIFGQSCPQMHHRSAQTPPLSKTESSPSTSARASMKRMGFQSSLPIASRIPNPSSPLLRHYHPVHAAHAVSNRRATSLTAAVLSRRTTLALTSHQWY